MRNLATRSETVSAALRPRRGKRLALGTALLFLLAACTPAAERGGTDATPAGGGAGPGDTGSTPAQNGPATTAEFPIVAYTGADKLGAEELDFTELLGQGKPVVLNFWAGQCPPCRAEMPSFQRVYDRLGDSFLLVGVDIGPFIGLGSQDDARRLLTDLEITYPTAYAVNERPVFDYGVVSMPTTIFYTADGREHSRHSGLMTEQQMEAVVQEIVGGGP